MPYNLRLRLTPNHEKLLRSLLAASPNPVSYQTLGKPIWPNNRNPALKAQAAYSAIKLTLKLHSGIYLKRGVNGAYRIDTETKARIEALLDK